ncbi:glycoside hydrolase [Clavulina sp. PMI_390]|nr:glycoside hydrolase [Clavulina sp. PMI_390]
MPRVKNISPATGLPVPEHYIHTAHARFVDTKGRSLLLRGVNLAGTTKQPPGFQSQRLEDYWESAEAGGSSFVGHPLNLDDGTADVHLARLRGWGFNMLRYIVTWEALEHQGPGKYDYEFMDYTVRVLRRCKAFGFKVFMDPHQDLWSRFCGGDGAPYWTLAACGLEPRNFTKTQATLLHSEWPNPEEPEPAQFPAMIWSTNYDRLACFTLFTMFFGGRDFAPKCTIDGVNIQDFLTSHYVQALGKLADRIRDAGDLLDSCVIGWDSMNEPTAGFIGHENLNEFISDQGMKKGTRPTPAQSLRLGMGMSQTVETWGFNQFGPKLEGTVTVDPQGTKAWMDPTNEPEGRNLRWGWKRGREWKLGTCPWALHDVWDPESGYILIPDYFKSPPSDPSRNVDFIEDYFRAHWRTYFDRIRKSHPDAIPFIQPPVFVRPPKLDENDLRGRGCYSPHYYDGLTLITRHWNWFNADALGVLRGRYASPVLAVKFGERAIRQSLQKQLSEYLIDVAETFGEFPTLMGEIGTPMDMDQKASYMGAKAGDYTNQQKALDASLNACDGPNALNYTIWTYCPDNTHEWGDGWNLEDLSLFSPNDLGGPESTAGARYRMRSSGAGRGRDAINDHSNAQLLLTRASSVNLDRMDLDRRTPGSSMMNPSYPHLPTASQSVATLGSSDPPSGAHSRTLYRFLTNGARAVGGFNRPYPIATVGTVADIQFNIAKAEFKLTVKVTEEDVLAATSSPTSETGSDPFFVGGRRSEDTEKEEIAPTEIFIPLVHFAEDPFARRAPASIYSQASIITQQPPLPIISRPSDSSDMPLRSAPPQLPEHGYDVPLALDIEASEGSRWEVEGQVLKWWYPGPSASSSSSASTKSRRGADAEKVNEDGSAERWIRIRRRGGAIKGIGTKEVWVEKESESMWDWCPKWY